MQTSPVKNGDENDLESEASSWGWGRDALKTAPMETEKGYYGATLEDGARPIRIEWNNHGFRCLPFWGLTLLVIYVYYRRLEKSLEKSGILEPAEIAAYCDGVDDDAADGSDAACRTHDVATFCGPTGGLGARNDALRSIFGPGGPCRDACVYGGALPCLWSAISHLRDFCDGEFEFVFDHPEDEDETKGEGEGEGPERSSFDCARAAVCSACRSGNAKDCARVADHYGEDGKPLFGASAAVRALADRGTWCDAGPA